MSLTLTRPLLLLLLLGAVAWSTGCGSDEGAADRAADDTTSRGTAGNDEPVETPATPTNDTMSITEDTRYSPRPTAPFRIDGACPFECCGYGEWTTTEETTVYGRAGDSTAVAFTLPAKTKVTAETGFVLLHEIGAAVITKPMELWRLDAASTTRPIAAGDTVLVLDHVGEGQYNVWYADSIYRFDGNAFSPERAPADMTAELVTKPRPDWWVRIVTSDGKSGWLWMERTARMEGADYCG